MEGGLLDSGEGEEREQKPSAAAAAGARELQANISYSLGSGERERLEKIGKSYSLGSGERERLEKIGKSYSLGSGERERLEKIGSGEGEEQEKRVQKLSAAAGATSYSLGSAFLVLTIAYAALVLYVTETYTHSWMEKLQMLPLCIVAVTPPMLWAIMFRKFHGLDAKCVQEIDTQT